MSGPHPDPLALDQNLEPSAVATMGTACETVLMASIAVSLKRIADKLEQIAPNGLDPWFLDQAAYNAGLSFERGRR
ncbi:hypothetical protein [Phenylobacterium sp.]|uniref:hypothetical protein n=1 Tax=Phenylobacterium sp. TaxID=1871053 RepID=UPI002731E2F9|nr:hypothetical protein [Phenylobacterium sp.]MDP1598982.1 hypothetical protein [Phenylobacterium sp.]MDP3590410.1 hypothetical protein [Phenylobacterium sp.]